MEVESMPGTKELSLKNLKTPQLVCLIAAAAGGTKLFQSYLDTHPEIYMIPGYPIRYFYPNWERWQIEMKDNWNWTAIINIFCVQHASIIDSRRIPSLNGLDALGDNQNEHVEINETQFKFYLNSLLRTEEITSRNFVLAVHYAYALCKNEDISKKKILLWHHHVYEYLDSYMKDFPDSIVIGTIRDPRPRMYRAWETYIKVNAIKLNKTDQILDRANSNFNYNRQLFNRLHTLIPIAKTGRVFLIRHEDLALKLQELMEYFASLTGIKYLDSMLKTTYDGKLWWGHEIHGMPKVTGTYSRVVSKDWQKTIPKTDVFKVEGIYYDFYLKYDYELLYYKKDTFINRFLLCLAILLLSELELKDMLYFLNPKTHIAFLAAAYLEAVNPKERKDYYFNSSYRYRWEYIDLKLWEKRFYLKLLERAENNLTKNKSVIAKALLMLARGIYFIARYIYFLVVVLSLPWNYFRRVKLQYCALHRRLNNRMNLPDLLKILTTNK